MKVQCVRGPVFVDGAMMFSGQVKEVPHEEVARRLVLEHPDALSLVADDVVQDAAHQVHVVTVEAEAQAASKGKRARR